MMVFAGVLEFQIPWRLLGILLVVCETSGGQFNPFLDPSLNDISSHALDQCFCELKGKVDECCCDVETVNSLNQNHILPMISGLVTYPFFKFYRVNLHRSCPFWVDDGACVLKDCNVEECSEDTLPPYLKGQLLQPGLFGGFCSTASPSEEEISFLSEINSTISPAQREHFSVWQSFDFSEDNFCDVEDQMASLGSYVDLTLNPEQYTGYSGRSPHRVWRAIYHENCFRPDVPEGLPSTLPPFHPSLLREMCLEKRAFYRVISGLHASISIHLSAKYLVKGGTNPKFGPNLPEFVRRFDAGTTKGQDVDLLYPEHIESGPVWLKNLYFAYLLVLRAIVKAEPYWKQYQFYTGSKSEDHITRVRVAKLTKAAKSCSSLFDETMMFTDNSSATLKNEFRSHFRNISRIMDCVGCDKCRLWGKLQVQGIGTAMKILFSERKTISLNRTEIVTLFNVLERFSQSIQSLENFKDATTET